ncbi:6-carboxytetrahydropterin synthase [Pseudoalteromonas denitrificans]|uniref:6-carboxy-5,6,7,8-tetrahydropterin synthase n=1 Tax=Pseudoalteromonas denitrificans DSM 6059 TaxID=1123010 RepID=A0A1I1FZA6_9GAMM|nr:6-carboxytetrahydropterin synthase [Pseudoalteromonas denitrificans]SFC04939.1 6-pyruvoyl tetrahydropterin synthase [Pseudoalteromonas denitrificans DSM 6059]
MILFVNDLTVIDFSYLCEKRGAVGESWIVDLTLHGSLNEESMILDFGLVKKQIKKIIDEKLDHKLALPINSNISVKSSNTQTNINFSFADEKEINISAPHEAFCSINATNITEQTVIDYLTAQIMPLLPKNIEKIELTLRAEDTNGFYYHYSHGLKKHDGNCQRIVHGHRSTIGIFENDMKSVRLQKEWALRWEDIYLGSAEDIIVASLLKFVSPVENAWHFAYEAPQGYFELSISKSQCEILPVDTTVECIAQYIADELKSNAKSNTYKVIAYEGVGKGAIAYA